MKFFEENIGINRMWLISLAWLGIPSVDNT